MLFEHSYYEKIDSCKVKLKMIINERRRINKMKLSNGETEFSWKVFIEINICNHIILKDDINFFSDSKLFICYKRELLFGFCILLYYFVYRTLAHASAINVY